MKTHAEFLEEFKLHLQSYVGNQRSLGMSVLAEILVNKIEQFQAHMSGDKGLERRDHD